MLAATSVTRRSTRRSENPSVAVPRVQHGHPILSDQRKAWLQIDIASMKRTWIVLENASKWMPISNALRTALFLGKATRWIHQDDEAQGRNNINIISDCCLFFGSLVVAAAMQMRATTNTRNRIRE
jgi:hypothetical protein